MVRCGWTLPAALQPGHPLELRVWLSWVFNPYPCSTLCKIALLLIGQREKGKQGGEGRRKKGGKDKRETEGAEGVTFTSILGAPHLTNAPDANNLGECLLPKLLFHFEKDLGGKLSLHRSHSRCSLPHRPREAAPIRPSTPGRKAEWALVHREGGSVPVWKVRLPSRSAALSPSFWSSSYFLWFCSHVLPTHIVKQYDKGFHVSKLKAFNSSTSKFTFSSTIHLPKTPPIRAPHFHPTFFQTCSLLSLSDSSKILHQFLRVPSFLCPSIHVDRCLWHLKEKTNRNR